MTGGLALDGWWAIDVAGYLLTRVDGLSPGTGVLDADEVVAWIRANELAWSPGAIDPTGTIPWGGLASGDDAALVEAVLGHAVDELAAPHADARVLAARRLLPTSTLRAYGLATPATGFQSEVFADGHVHQGAALPFEVTLRWVATSLTSIGQPDPACMLTDTAGRSLDPFPLLLLLRNLVERPQKVDERFLGMALASAVEGGDASDRFNAAGAFDRPFDGEPLTIAQIEDEKHRARQGQHPLQRVARLRVEAIVLGAVTQRKAGLDVFVDLFERFASMRRGHFPKAKYYEKSIAMHAAQSGHSLRRLELRLGERINPGRCSQQALEAEYEKALLGYRAEVGNEPKPIAVTFPLGLVKSPRSPGPSDHWRFDASGIYDTVGALLATLRSHPRLRAFVDGIDVCGFELGEPNWLFAGAFEQFAKETADWAPRPACRFHAGEWHWTSLHGLRRIGEFVQFPLPIGTPRRIGHGLALASDDWDRLCEQPLHELLDDLVWARDRLAPLDVPVGTLRLVERMVIDLRGVVYREPLAAGATVDELMSSYRARFDASALERISFLHRVMGKLEFPDRPPTPRSDRPSQLLVAQLRRDAVREVTLADAIEGQTLLPGWSIPTVQSALAELYGLLAPEVIDDVRWGGVVIEACPTSNVLAGGVRGYRRHPMRQLIDAGVLTTINTDDPSIFHAWMRDEIRHAEGEMGVSPRAVHRARDLGLSVVAPALSGIDVRAALDDALKSLAFAVTAPAARTLP